MTPVNNKNPEPWTCVSIGYEIEPHKNIFKSTGNPATKTKVIISQNITRLAITKKWDPFMYLIQVPALGLCEGVLIS